MGLPTLRFSYAIVVFVLADDGRTETIGGQIEASNELAAAAARGRALPRLIEDEVRRFLPRGAMRTRVRPLMPRFSDPTTVVLPLWTFGRVDADWRGARLGDGGTGDDLRFGAIERLAARIGDLSLVAEAGAEFRRALLSDPMTHQMIPDAARLRALARDESDRDGAHDELPPIFAMLPDLFTIEELRGALRCLGHAVDDGVESSSNFRRRVAEFLEQGVLVDAGEVGDWQQKGRPPRLYRFVHPRWLHWLRRRAASAHARKPQAIRRSIAEKIDPQRQLMHPRASASGASVDDDAGLRIARAKRELNDAAFEPHHEVQSLRDIRVMRSEMRVLPILAEESPEIEKVAEAASSGGDDRVERLEAMVRRLAEQVDRLSEKPPEAR
ncbi:MAG: hypothetical protein ACKO0W_11330 [Planctomycetota bacterium]